MLSLFSVLPTPRRHHGQLSCLSLAAACGLGFIASGAMALPPPAGPLSGTPAFTIVPNPSTNGFAGSSLSMGYSFTVSSNRNVVALGLYDAGADGIVGLHDVGIFDNGGHLLGSTTVSNSSTLDNFFRYENLATPIALQTGQTYYVAGVTGSDYYQYLPTSITYAPGINFLNSAYDFSSTLIFPTQTGLPNAYFGGSFRFASTVSGPLLENSAPVGIPTNADFMVIGPVQTGTLGENNSVNTLTFTTGGSLIIHHTLTVSQGPVTLVPGSTIDLDGTLATSQLNILPFGLLQGNGGINGNVINAGVVSPGHSPGKITITGNYTQTPTGALAIQFAGRQKSQFDQLQVGGKATLDGALQLVALDKFQFHRGDQFQFLTAGGGVNGEFAAVFGGGAAGTILAPTIVYRDHSVSLEVPTFSQFAEAWSLTPNQRSVAAAVDSVGYSSKTKSLTDYLDRRSLTKLPGDFDKIAPEELTSMFTIGVSLATVQSLNIQRRTDDLRSGTSGFNAAGLALNGAGPSYSGGFNLSTGVAGPSGDDKDSKFVQNIVPQETRWGAFLSGTGEWVSVGDTDNARGYDLTSGGFTLGLDYKVTPNLAIGLAAGYTGTSADLNDRGRVYVNGGKLGLYATYFQTKEIAPAPTMSKDSSKDSSKEAPVAGPVVAQGLYVDFAAFGGYNSYDTRRSGLNGETRGDTDGGELNVLFGTGYDFKKGALTFGPTATFNYTYLGTSDYTEHGSLAPLDIHGGKGESLRTAFGFKASYDWKVGSVLIRPEIRAAWQHEFGDAAYDLSSNFANGGGNSFSVAGPELGRDSVLVGAGFAIQCSERCSTYFYYDGELGRKNYQSSSVTGGFRIEF